MPLTYELCIIDIAQANTDLKRDSFKFDIALSMLIRQCSSAMGMENPCNYRSAVGHHFLKILLCVANPVIRSPDPC
jgi:hypothetical protein